MAGLGRVDDLCAMRCMIFCKIHRDMYILKVFKYHRVRCRSNLICFDSGETEAIGGVSKSEGLETH